MPKDVKIKGCGSCPFAYKYRSEWECGFKMGYVIQHYDDYFADWCPLINDDGVLLIADKV